MDLTYSAEDEAFRQRVHDWLEAHLPVTINSFEDRRAWHRQLYEAGLIGAGWPVDYGGRGARPMEQAIIAEEMSKMHAPGGASGAGIGLVGPTLIAHGTEAQTKRYLPKILRAEEIWCELYSEPSAGSDLASLQTRAIREGDEYVVNGQKIWTSGGMNSDLGILLARTDPAAPKHEGISYFIIDMHTPGVEVRPLRQITGNEEFCQVFFTNVRLPAENLIGQEGQGWTEAQTTLGFERGGNTLAGARGRRAAIQRLIDVCQAEGIIEDPLVRNKLGCMLVDVEVMRASGLRVLSKLEKGGRPGAESSIDKLFNSETEQRNQEWFMDILGPVGQLTGDLPDPFKVHHTGTTIGGNPLPDDWTYPFLWSRAMTIFAGSSEIQRNIIGERLLSLPRELRMDRLPEQMQGHIRARERSRAERRG